MRAPKRALALSSLLVLALLAATGSASPSIYMACDTISALESNKDTYNVNISNGQVNAVGSGAYWQTYEYSFDSNDTVYLVGNFSSPSGEISVTYQDAGSVTETVSDPFSIALNQTSNQQFNVSLPYDSAVGDGASLEYLAVRDCPGSYNDGPDGTGTVPEGCGEDTTAPKVSNIRVSDASDGDGTVESGETLQIMADLSGETGDVNASSIKAFINPATDGPDVDMSYDSATLEATGTYTVQNASSLDLNYISVEAADDTGNVGSAEISNFSVTVEDVSSGNDTTEYNITTLRDVPGQQSFDYLNSGDSTNITVENNTVTGDSDDAVYLTRQIRADKYDRIELDTSGSVTVEVLDAQNDSENESVLKTKTVSGMATINISDLNTTGIQVRMKLDNGTEITDFKLYGDQYSGGLFGGGNLITGNFFGDIPVVGNFLSGMTAGVNNVVSGILNVPAQIFEGLMGLIPSL